MDFQQGVSAMFSGAVSQEDFLGKRRPKSFSSGLSKRREKGTLYHDSHWWNEINGLCQQVNRNTKKRTKDSKAQLREGRGQESTLECRRGEQVPLRGIQGAKWGITKERSEGVKKLSREGKKNPAFPAPEKISPETNKSVGAIE